MAFIIAIVVGIILIWIFMMVGWGALNLLGNLLTLNFKEFKENSDFVFLLLGLLVCVILFVGEFSGIPIFSLIIRLISLTLFGEEKV